jgi:2-C-methyl-D-erythritol 4-phosphate cytidylyltransferase
MTEVVALIPAAGLGRRMGPNSVRKAFIAWQGRPLIWKTLDALSRASSIDRLVMALHLEDLAFWSELKGLSEAEKNWKPLQIIAGGASRTESVEQAFLQALKTSRSFLALVHDGARPFVRPELVDRCVKEAEKTGAALAVLPVVDTVKEVLPGGLLKSLKRESLFAAQTPQVIRSDLFEKAFAFWHERGCPSLTDDVQLLEKLNIPISLVEGNRDNRKITYADDLLLEKKL